MREEEQIVKTTSPTREVVEQDKNDSLQRETMLSFLHYTKLKANSMLQVDSWIYNEIMGLKKKLDNVQQNQDIDHAKISQMEVQVGNFPKKLKDYEQNLQMSIKESSNKMEQVTSSIYAIAASLGNAQMERLYHQRVQARELGRVLGRGLRRLLVFWLLIPFKALQRLEKRSSK